MAEQHRVLRLDRAAADERFDGGSRALLRAREGEGVVAVAVTGKINRVRAQAVAGEIFSEIQHQAAICGKAMEEYDAASRLYIGRRLKNCHWRAATAGGQRRFLLWKFGGVNPVDSHCK